jgi:hypothetical protein
VAERFDTDTRIEDRVAWGGAEDVTIHGLTGVAPTGIELHPVLWFVEADRRS